MIETIVGSLLAAWILALFGFDDVVINGMREMFGLNVTVSSYYLIFVIVGSLITVISALKG